MGSSPENASFPQARRGAAPSTRFRAVAGGPLPLVALFINKKPNAFQPASFCSYAVFRTEQEQETGDSEPHLIQLLGIGDPKDLL
ncbi:MAG: hypothetical protein Q4G69_04820 [Planctomycetia bacterium]|nr:hypothetical protein [Planctomycetia bacterium]